MNEKKNIEAKNRMKRIYIAVIAVITTALLLYSGFTLIYFVPADAKITTSLESYNYVEEENWYLFQGQANNTNDAIFFYPHPRVDEKAYFYLASRLQSSGFNVFLSKSFLHQPILSTNLLEKAQEKYPRQDRWIIGGHLGGTKAVEKVSKKHTEKIDAAFLLGEIPNEKVLNLNIPLLILVGENEAADKKEESLRNAAMLDDDISFNIIQNADNAGFGLYSIGKNEQVDQVNKRMFQQDVAAIKITKFIRSELGTITSISAESAMETEKPAEDIAA